MRLLFHLGKVVLPPHETAAETPPCPTRSQKMAIAIIWLLAYALAQNQS
jgi:hypothetical protein